LAMVFGQMFGSLSRTDYQFPTDHSSRWETP
jgi:hypothetical protein